MVLKNFPIRSHLRTMSIIQKRNNGDIISKAQNNQRVRAEKKSI